jgi:hypothetical protein
MAAPPNTSVMPISDIVIGPRHRRDLGDIDVLAASIAELTLLQPIVIRPVGCLIDGRRRLRAAEVLGWTEIPVHVVDLDAVVRGEFAASITSNSRQASWSPSARRSRRTSGKGRRHAKARALTNIPVTYRKVRATAATAPRRSSAYRAGHTRR